MSQSINKVILIGRLGRDPEVRNFQNGGKVASMSVATSESWRDRNSGERKERTEWHSVSLQQEGAVKFAEQYLRKGDLIYVEGQLQTRKWQDQSGQDRYSTEVVVRPYNGSISKLASAGEGSSGGGAGGYDDGYDDGGQNGGRGGRRSSGRSGGDGYGAGGRGGHSDMDDEIPFAPEVR